MTYMTIFQRIKLEFPIFPPIKLFSFGDDGDISKVLEM